MRIKFNLEEMPLHLDFTDTSSWIDAIRIEYKSRKKVIVKVYTKGKEYTGVVRKKTIQEFFDLCHASVGRAVITTLWDRTK